MNCFLICLFRSMGGRTTMQLALSSNLPLDKVVVVDVSPVNQVGVGDQVICNIFWHSRTLTLLQAVSGTWSTSSTV